LRGITVGEFNRKKLARMFAEHGICVGQAKALDERRTDRSLESRAVFGKEDDVRYALKEPRHAMQNLYAMDIHFLEGTELHGLTNFCEDVFKGHHRTCNDALLGSFFAVFMVSGQDGELSVPYHRTRLIEPRNSIVRSSAIILPLPTIPNTTPIP